VNYDFEPFPALDKLEIYTGNAVNPDSLIHTLNNQGSDTSFCINTTGSVTIRMRTDGTINAAGFEIDWYCSGINSSVTTTICQGDNYDGYTTSGIYMDTLSTISGCDSVRTLHLNVNPSSTETINTTICQGDSFLGYHTTGTYSDTLINTVNGCDSIRTIILTVENLPTPTIQQINDSTLESSLGDTYQWFLDGTAISNALNQTLTVNQSGNYSVKITSNNGCTAQSDSFSFIVVSNNEQLLIGSNIQVVPNPNYGFFNLQLDNFPTGSWEVSILNITGQVVQSEILEITDAKTNIPINVNNIDTGFYFIKMKNKDNLIIVKKFLIE